MPPVMLTLFPVDWLTHYARIEVVSTSDEPGTAGTSCFAGEHKQASRDDLEEMAPTNAV